MTRSFISRILFLKSALWAVPNHPLHSKPPAHAQFFTLPMIPLIVFDFPRRFNLIWQPVLLCAAWVLADVLIVEMYLCGFFSDDNECGNRNFLNSLAFAYGQPALAIMALKQNR